MESSGPSVRFRAAAARLASRAVRLKTSAEAESTTDLSMKKVLGAFDLLLLGVGGVVGGGVFVLTGAAAHDHAGPAVVLSYVIASLTSMITGLCYTEFAVETPVAGSAYNYVSQSFGEFAGFLCGCNLALELTISAAAVARGWTSYVATLFHAPPDALRLDLADGRLRLDLPAAALVVFISALLILGARETARFNAVVTAVSLAVIGFVIVAGGLYVDADNWTPFAPRGLPGVLSGASVVFFSFVGFDTVATCAEETRNPGRDLPIGIMGSLGVCALLYALMSLVITGMVPAANIDVEAPFAVAFRSEGAAWAESVISLGAVAAITTALLSSLMGQPRVYMVMARDGLLPRWFARVHPKFGTPANATAFTMLTTGTLAAIVDIEILAQLVSIGTLAVFGAVCAGLLARRHTPEDGTGRGPAARRIVALVASCVGFSVTYAATNRATRTRDADGEDNEGNGGGGDGGDGGSSASSASTAALVFFFAAIVASTLSFNTIPRHNAPRRGFETPLVPYLPAAGVMATTQLVASLGPLAWARFAAYTVACALGYAWFGVAGIVGGWGPEWDGVEMKRAGGEGGEDEEDGETSGLLSEGYVSAFPVSPQARAAKEEDESA